MNQNASMLRFMRRMNIDVTSPKNEIYNSHKRPQLDNSVVVTYAETSCPRAKAHSHKQKLFRFRHRHEAPIILIEGRDDRLQVADVALRSGWESGQHLRVEPN